MGYGVLVTHSSRLLLAHWGLDLPTDVGFCELALIRCPTILFYLFDTTYLPTKSPPLSHKPGQGVCLVNLHDSETAKLGHLSRVKKKKMLFDSIHSFSRRIQKSYKCGSRTFLLTTPKNSISLRAISPSYGKRRPDAKTYMDSVPDPISNHVVLFCLLQGKAKPKRISHMEYIQ